MDNQSLTAALLHQRPKLGASSIKTYCSMLRSLYATMKGENGIEFFQKESNKILEYI